MASFSKLTNDWLNQELHTDDTVLFTTARRNQAVNDGMDEFLDYTECVIRVSSVTVSCNVTLYDCLDSTVFGSSDFLRLSARQVEYHFTDSNGTLTQLSGDSFQRRDIEWLNKYESGWRQSTTPQTPTYYYVKEDDGLYQIGLWPPPDVGSSETARLVVPYIPQLPAMTSTGEEPFTLSSRVRVDLRPFHRALTHYAAYLLEKLRGDDQASDRQYAHFLNYVEKYTNHSRPKGENFVTMAKSYLRAAARKRPDWGRLSGRDPYRWP